MHVFVLLVTVFFIGLEKPPQVLAIMAPSASACTYAAPKLRDELLARADVRDAEVACFDVERKEKT